MKHLLPIKTLGFACACVALVSVPLNSEAKPARHGIIDYTQPDGSVIKITLTGDENSHATYDTNGQLLVEDANGYLVPASIQPAGKESPKAMRAAAGVKSKYLYSGTPFPSEGEPHGLVILAQFTDTKFSMANPKDFYTRMLNEEGFKDYGATGSARDFFIYNSMGIFQPHFDVYGPITTKEKASYYGRNDFYGYDLHPEEVIIEALQQLDPSVDFSKYDTNNDGVIDNVFVFYAGKGEADSGVKSTIWPHSSDLDSYNLGKDYIFDNVRLNRYGMTNEIDSYARRPDGIGTFVHEFSHVLGLPDLYTTDYTEAFTPDSYSALDYGPYNNDGLTPPNYSIFERYCMGWMQPETFKAEGEHILEPIDLSNQGYIINTENKDEFYLLENRQQHNNDRFIPGHGMIVWHVDFVQNKWDENEVNNDKNHQHVDLVEADNRRTESTRSGDTFPGASGVTDFDYATVPSLRSWGGLSTGVHLSDIAEDGKTVKFNVSLDEDYQAAVKTVDSVCDEFKFADGVLTNASSCNAYVYGIGGVLLANMQPGTTLDLRQQGLQPGLVIVYCNGTTRKFFLK